MEKKALGRGLDALLPTGRNTADPERGDVQELRLEAVVPNRFQPRQQFSEVELAELTASLKQNGLLQPILVRRKGDGIYELSRLLRGQGGTELKLDDATKIVSSRLGRDRFRCDRCERMGVKCVTWLMGAYCNGLARTGDRVDSPLCAVCLERVGGVGKNVAVWALMGAIGGLMKRRK